METCVTIMVVYTVKLTVILEGERSVLESCEFDEVTVLENDVLLTNEPAEEKQFDVEQTLWLELVVLLICESKLLTVVLALKQLLFKELVYDSWLSVAEELIALLFSMKRLIVKPW